ncbi:MAG: TlpA family protein disulfide reductase [Thermodesulfobacteriota bacterium]
MVYRYKVSLSLFILIAISMLSLGISQASEDPWEKMGVTKIHETQAPEFVLPTIDGKLIAINDFRGKVVFINFWATWCIPCRKEMPSMERLHNRYKDKGLVILAVDVMEDTNTVQGFMDELGLTFLALMDKKDEVSPLYSVYAIPTSYLIDKKGKIRGRAIGARDWSYADAFRLIEELLEEK